MRFVLTTYSSGGSKSCEIGSWAFLLSVLGIATVVFYLGIFVSGKSGNSPLLELESYVLHWDDVLNEQNKEIYDLSVDISGQTNGLLDGMAMLQERLVHLDALGEYLISQFNFNNGEFDFSWEPSGNNEIFLSKDNKTGSIATLFENMMQLSEKITDRRKQLDLLHQLLREEQHKREVTVSELPVEHGRCTSKYGERINPFTGILTMHKGVDFAGKPGTGILSVASGVVTYVGYRGSYGLLVEINHGNKYMTRYAHNQSANVDVGDVVMKGQQVACMGNSGRSTSDHLHFEVLLDGEAIDPGRFLYEGASFISHNKELSTDSG